MAKAKKTLQTLVSNISGTVRHEKMEGRDYLVAPMVMLVEGVHAGSGGPILYLGADMEKTAPIWNHKPIVVYHPENGGSACDPIVLTEQKVGVVLNTGYKTMVTNSKRRYGKLPAEAWMEPSRLEAIDPRILEALESDSPMELSTGLWTDNENSPGVWKGPNGDEPYDVIARNYGPDHLALLPDKEGACSVAKGAGLLRNELMTNHRGVMAHLLDIAKGRMGLTVNGLSFGDITRRLYDSLADKFGKKGKSWNGWVADVYDSFVIYYNDEGKLYQHNYSMTNGAVKLSGDPLQVQTSTVYSKVANAAPTPKESSMKTKIEIVDGLIANEKSGWVEGDREALMGLSDDQVAKLAPVANADEKGTPAPTPTPAPNPTQAPAPTPAPTPAPAPGQVQNAAPTFNEVFATASPEIQELINMGIQEGAAKKANLIGTIVANEANMFTKEQLAAKGVGELTALAALAARPKEAVQPTYPNYFGAAGGALVGNAAAGAGEPLGLPDYEAAAAN